MATIGNPFRRPPLEDAMHARTLALLALLQILPVAAPAQDLAASERSAEDAVQRLRGAMMQEMQKAMGGGTVEAIGVCRHLAPEISAAIEAETGWHIRRPALRVRNPEMRPTPAERAVLLGFEARHAAGQPVRLLRTLRRTETDGRIELHFMQAIPMMAGCVACHGTSIDPQTAGAIRALYPDDAAVGYAVGDLRGAFSLTRTIAPEEPAPAAAAVLPRPTLETLDYVPTDRPGARGDAARGAAAFARHCQSCHAADQMARHAFGSGDPAAGDRICRKLETHGFGGRDQDCDIVAFLNDLALFLTKDN